MADEALWIDHARVAMRGDPKKVVDAYLAQVTHLEEEALAAAEARTVAEFEAPRREESGKESEIEPTSAFARERGRWGSREVEIQEVSFLDASGSAKHVFATGEPVTVRLKVSSTGTIEDFVFGVAIFNADGICCYGTNTHLEEFTPVRFSGSGRGAVRHSRASAHRRHVLSRRRRPPARRLPFRLPPRAPPVPRAVESERRRDLPAAATAGSSLGT